MKEIYVDEKGGQNSDSSSWGGGLWFGGGGGGGGAGWGGGGAGWGGGGGSGGDGASWGGNTPDTQGIIQVSECLRLTASGCLMMDETGDLLFCCQECPDETPMLTITLKRDSSVEEEIERSHARCIQVNLVYTQLNPLLNEPAKNLVYDLWPEDASSEAHYAGNFPLPEPGELLTIKLMWQKGHHDINQLSKMRVTVCGVDCGTKTFSRNNWKSVATISVEENGLFTVNGLYGKLRKR